MYIRAAGGLTAEDECAMRRIIDVSASLALMFLLLPLLLLIVLLMKAEDSGPVLQSEWRVNGDENLVRLLRFRTTSPGTNRWSSKPTRVGRLLCQANLDELPILLNILRGDITLYDAFTRTITTHG